MDDQITLKPELEKFIAEYARKKSAEGSSLLHKLTKSGRKAGQLAHQNKLDQSLAQEKIKEAMLEVLLSEYDLTIKSIVRGYWPRIQMNPSLDIDDLYQEGRIGFLKALETYDHEKNPSFIGFARRHINGKIEESFPLTKSDRVLLKKIRKCKEQLTQSMRQDPTEEAIAECVSRSSKSGRSASDILAHWRVIESNRNGSISIDSGDDDDNGPSILDGIPDESIQSLDPFSRLETTQSLDLIASVAPGLVSSEHEENNPFCAMLTGALLDSLKRKENDDEAVWSTIFNLLSVEAEEYPPAFYYPIKLTSELVGRLRTLQKNINVIGKIPIHVSLSALVLSRKRSLNKQGSYDKAWVFLLMLACADHLPMTVETSST